MKEAFEPQKTITEDDLDSLSPLQIGRNLGVASPGVYGSALFQSNWNLIRKVQETKDPHLFEAMFQTIWKTVLCAGYALGNKQKRLKMIDPTPEETRHMTGEALKSATAANLSNDLIAALRGLAGEQELGETPDAPIPPSIEAMRSAIEDALKGMGLEGKVMVAKGPMDAAGVIQQLVEKLDNPATRRAAADAARSDKDTMDRVVQVLNDISPTNKPADLIDHKRLGEISILNNSMAVVLEAIKTAAEMGKDNPKKATSLIRGAIKSVWILAFEAGAHYAKVTAAEGSQEPVEPGKRLAGPSTLASWPTKKLTLDDINNVKESEIREAIGKLFPDGPSIPHDNDHFQSAEEFLSNLAGKNDGDTQHRVLVEMWAKAFAIGNIMAFKKMVFTDKQAVQ